ncbi:hypothetical protein FOA43_004389 [Brettanomyces nanus]|uniref:Large ribosomal subunit protein mL44 n=1 Tax=Eeniella nana TaxID=13502 RepID=A0A875SA79_EENNA|nr:uncharacterized protein FOA43_004389 [Brettanomyces nanus]QPG76995.1 hypothetical protein FOA43_004389 [Brettanomyces nanus]
MLGCSRRLFYRVRLSPIRRTLSTSPVKPNPLTVAPARKRNFKFSYERSSHTIVEEPELKVPENKLDFANYQRNSYKLKISEEDAKKIPSILTLHARLVLSSKYQYSTLVRALTCQMKENEYADNKQMALFGANLLSFYVTENLISNYPRLPISILKTATDAYIGDFSLCDVAQNSWGIEQDETSNLEKYLSSEPKLFRFGRLRYDKHTTQVEKGITKFDNVTVTSLDHATAFADAVRAIVAGVYAHDGEEITKKFIQSHVLSRKIDISSMFQFREPGKLLSRLLRVKQMEPPTVRLISETGRLSNSPIFVVGCFSGDSMLAGGEGSSLKEARIRSFVNALKAFYLYKPLDSKMPSDDDFKPLFVDEGEPFY